MGGVSKKVVVVVVVQEADGDAMNGASKGRRKEGAHTRGLVKPVSSPLLSRVSWLLTRHSYNFVLLPPSGEKLTLLNML
ncbi:hypothetical protein NL676_016037 [Syzygium grande]|nr:hypothetical protein NL676_016037 [Syzygium grande]